MATVKCLWLFFALLGSEVGLVQAALADELRLANGDRYTGEVVQLGGGTLSFKTPHGTVSVPWSEVSSLTVDDAIVVTTADGEVTTQPGAVIDVPATTGLSRPVPPLALTGGAGAGLIATGGNTSVNSLRLDGNVLVRLGDNRYSFAGDINRAEDRGTTTAKNWTVSGRYDRFLTKRVFVNGSATFTNDRFRDLDLRAAYGAGLGYQVLDLPSYKLKVDGGFGYVNETFDVADDNRYAAARESSTLDIVVVAERLVLFHQHDAYIGVTGDENLFVQTENGVRFTVVGGLITTVRLDVDYDRSPAPGRRNTDRTFAWTLGYRF